MKKLFFRLLIVLFVLTIICQNTCHAMVRKIDMAYYTLNIIEAILYFGLIAFGGIYFILKCTKKEGKVVNIFSIIFHGIGLLLMITLIILLFKYKDVGLAIVCLIISILYLIMMILRKRGVLTAMCIILVLLMTTLVIIDANKSKPLVFIHEKPQPDVSEFTIF